MNLINKIKNLIKIGMKTETIDEKNIKVEFLGQEKEVLKIIPYGLMYKLPDDDIITVVLQQEGNEDALLGLCTDIKNRDDDLLEKDVKVGIPTLLSRLWFRSNVDDSDVDEIEMFTPEIFHLNINDELDLNMVEDEIILTDKNGNTFTIDSSGIIIEDTNGNIFTLDSSGVLIEDANGNDITMGTTSVTINGNLEVLQ